MEEQLFKKNKSRKNKIEFWDFFFIKRACASYKCIKSEFTSQAPLPL